MYENLGTFLEMKGANIFGQQPTLGSSIKVRVRVRVRVVVLMIDQCNK